MIEQGIIKVILADDHTMVRQALSQVLEESNDRIRVVGQARDGIEALQLVEAVRPDVLLLDYSMPELDGPEVVRALRKRRDPVRLLVLTVHEQIHYAVTILELGANGFIIKSAAVEELVTAIHCVCDGGVYVSPKLAGEVHTQLERTRGNRSGLNALSPREFDVLSKIANGMSVSECAIQLNISKPTAATYRTRLMAKLGLASTTEIIRFGIEHGITQ